MEIADPDATLVLAPPRPAAEAQPPLRADVLAGRYFGAARADEASRLADFLAARTGAAGALAAWFGPSHAARLAAGSQDALQGALDRDIAALDALIAEQLDAVLHHPRLRRLEGSWRGLHWLAEGIDPAGRVKIRLLHLPWAELCRDLERAAEFDQSHLFRQVYEAEFGMPGGEPYGLLLIDHEVRHRPAPGAPTDDMAALAALSAVAAAAFAPTVLGASPALLEVDGFADLALVADVGASFRGADHARWRALSSRDDMRFLAVALPRVLARPPWRDDPGRADGFRYAEYAPDADSRVWMGAGYAFAANVARAFAENAWPADVRGAQTDREGGGLVTHLPVEPFATDPDHVWVRPALEVALTERQERQLIEAGLMPLSALPLCEEAVFGSVRSLQAPATHLGANAEAADANARISAQLNAMLCASRFAHYLKVLGRDMVGAFRTADEIEQQLQQWVRNYVNASQNAGPETRARYPLLAARVTVAERPGRPGVFGCVIQLQPHFQLDDLAATFRLVTEIAAPGAAR